MEKEKKAQLKKIYLISLISLILFTGLVIAISITQIQPTGGLF